MATCERSIPLVSLELPNEFEDLSGLLETDLKVTVPPNGFEYVGDREIDFVRPTSGSFNADKDRVCDCR